MKVQFVQKSFNDDLDLVQKPHSCSGVCLKMIENLLRQANSRPVLLKTELNVKDLEELNMLIT